MTLAEEITNRLQILCPSNLKLENQSSMHVGHIGNAGGGHFKLQITSSHFFEKSQIIRHRIIYQALADLIPTKIHALSIEAFAPNEL